MYLNNYIKDKTKGLYYSNKVEVFDYQEINLMLVNFLSTVMIEHNLYSDKIEIGTDYITEQEYNMK